MNEGIPPANTTTLVLHFNTRRHDPVRHDLQFTIAGIHTGRPLGKWVQLLISEHLCPDLDSTIEVWHHHPSGAFESTEITTCRA